MTSKVFVVARGLCKRSYNPSVICTLSREYSSETLSTTENEIVIDGKKYVDRVVDDSELESMRDISRLTSKYRNRMLHVSIPDPNETHPDHYDSLFHKPEFKKFLFACYGKKSGINPGCLWPSEAELQDTIEYEKEWEPSLQNMWDNLKQEKEADMKAIREKEELITARMAKMPQCIEDYRKSLKKEEEKENVVKAKKQALLEEARDNFGYYIDTSDPRFEQMKLAKEEEEKKLAKKRKKEAKAARITTPEA